MMKKLFSLFCAIAIAFSASAAPIAPKAELANFNQLSATPELKVINQEAKAKIGPKDMVAQSRSVAPRKGYSSTLAYKCGPTEVVVTDLSTPTYNEFKLTITQKAKNTAEYSKQTLYDNTVELILDPDEHSIVGTFTTDDYTIGASSFLKSGSNTRYVSYWENSTITIVSKGGNKYAITDGLLQVENSTGKTLYKYDYCYAAADLNNQDAEKTAFEFTFGEEPTPPQPSYDTIPVTVAAYQENYFASSLDWQVIMYDTAGNGYSLDVFAPAEGFEDGKTYTSDNNDFDLEYTFAQVNGVGDAAVKASFTKTETEDTLTVTAEMTTAGNHVYQFTYVLDKTVEIVDANGIIIQPAKGETKEYNRLTTNTCFYDDEGIKLTYQFGKATLVECADGTVYWKDPICAYTSGAWIKGKKEGSTITFATKQPVFYNTTYKASTSVRWGYFSTNPSTFTAADDYADSLILDIKEDSLIMRGTQATMSTTATYFPGIFWDDDNSFTGYGDCGVTLIERKPIVERDTVDVISNTMTYNEFIASNQAVQFYAGGDAEGYSTFFVTSKNATSVEGTFDIYVGYSFADSIDGSQISFEEGQITVTAEEKGIRLTGWVIGDNEKYYRLNWFQKAGTLAYDANAPFDATFAYEDMESSIVDGVISISATNAENFTIGLELYADPTATTIPEGTYTISDSQEAGTALKSLGANGGYPTECYAGTRAVSGGINVPCWFMVEGTVTLSYDEYGKLKVVVDAKNSYEQPVTVLVQYSATPTALPSLPYEGKVGKEAAKFLHNGQLIIRKGGKYFTAFGARIK